MSAMSAVSSMFSIPARDADVIVERSYTFWTTALLDEGRVYANGAPVAPTLVAVYGATNGRGQGGDRIMLPDGSERIVPRRRVTRGHPVHIGAARRLADGSRVAALIVGPASNADYYVVSSADDTVSVVGADMLTVGDEKMPRPDVLAGRDPAPLYEVGGETWCEAVCGLAALSAGV